ncbi:class F sortase [Aquipuribacter hungaricus]|uniref:Class F sortase n=1 Tax=Aquipuribacter hungaricus TaxID=545624 RepID=A0ABV7WFY6_9MICO
MTVDAGAAGSSRRARRPGAVLTVAAATVLLVGGGTAAAVGIAGRDVATPPPVVAQPATSSSPDPTTGPSAPAAPAPSAPATSPAPTPVQTAAPAPAALPVQVRIPSIGVDSPLLHLGLQDDGALEVPQGADFDTAAWYDGSPRPGDVGPAVIEGHVSSSARGPSVFFELSTLAVGDRVEVVREDGTTVAFEVYGIEQFPKDGFPTLDVYGNTPGPELRLITCGGTVAESTGRYTDNVVVFAHAVQG